jgi:hypothetical protein
MASLSYKSVMVRPIDTHADKTFNSSVKKFVLYRTNTGGFFPDVSIFGRSEKYRYWRRLAWSTWIRRRCAPSSSRIPNHCSQHVVLQLGIYITPMYTR